MKFYVFIAASLDGYIAKKDGDIEWLIQLPNPENEDFGYEKFIEKIDAIVMGRNTFEKVLSFNEWPYEKKVYVLSNSLDKIPHHLQGKVEIVSGTLKEITIFLEENGYNNIYVDGGITIQGFLKENLIDEMIISRIPIILGEGISLFGELGKEIKTEHIMTNIFKNGVVHSHYKIKK